MASLKLDSRLDEGMDGLSTRDSWAREDVGVRGGLTTLRALTPFAVLFMGPKQKGLECKNHISPNSANPIDFLELCPLHIFSVGFLRIKMVPFLSVYPQCLA